MAPKVIVSLFPGVGILDRAFEDDGFCVLRGPDSLWGGDVRRFSLPAGIAWGIIGGPPCQDFSSLRRTAPSGRGSAMLREFIRVVTAASPVWWILENVARVPDVKVKGYSHQRIDLNQSWYTGISRLRHFQFGTTTAGLHLQIKRGKQLCANPEPAALACDDRSFEELCRLQGLPLDFDLPGFTVEEKKRAVGNGVPIQLGRVVAAGIREAFGLPGVRSDAPQYVAMARRVCFCGCGRFVHGKANYDSPACRKRAERNRRQHGGTASTIAGSNEPRGSSKIAIVATAVTARGRAL